MIYEPPPATLFPAWAGVILTDMSLMYIWPSFPRMGGGDPDALCLPYPLADFSPHGRG